MPRLEVVWAADTGRDAAHALVRREVERFSGRSGIEVVHACRQCGSSDHGALHVPDVGGAPRVHVSLSRAAGHVVVATTDAGPVGVDHEARGAAGDGTLPAVVLHPDEPRTDDLTTVWVRKESVLKATGHGLTVDPRRIAVSTPGVAPRLVAWPADEASPGAVRMIDVDGPPGCVTVVTVLADDLPSVVRASAAAAG